MSEKKLRAKGFTPLMEEPEPFEVGERTYQFRRLGVGETFKLLGIVKQAATFGYEEAALILRRFSQYLPKQRELKEDGSVLVKELDINKIAFLLSPLFGVPECEILIKDFLNDITYELVRNEEDTETLKEDINVNDYNQIPMGWELVAIANLAKHPSIKAFLATAVGLQHHEAIQEALQYLRNK